MKLEQFQRYEATVKIREDDRFIIKPEIRDKIIGMNGNRYIFKCLWEIGEDESDLYCQEYAMEVFELNGEHPLHGWIASGDLTDIEEILPPKWIRGTPQKN